MLYESLINNWVFSDCCNAARLGPDCAAVYLTPFSFYQAEAFIDP